MNGLNKVFLMGNLTRDPELRYIPTGTAVADLRLAVNRSYQGRDGQKKEEVLFCTVVVWGKIAEICAEKLHKGSPVHVEGRLQLRQWETKSGDKREVIEVVAEGVNFLGRAGSDPDAPKSRTEAKRDVDMEAPDDDEVPF